MRIHTNVLTDMDVRSALAAEQALGRIASHVTFKQYGFRQHRSTTHRAAFEIQLEAAVRDRGRRAGNSGSYGAMRPEYGGYAATYDEWGWLLAALYAKDFDMLVGSSKCPVYVDRVHFDERTALAYNPRDLLDSLEFEAELGHGFDPYPFVTGAAARTKRGYLVGRYGAPRMDYATAWNVERPRTAAEYRAFAFPESPAPHGVAHGAMGHPFERSAESPLHCASCGYDSQLHGVRYEDAKVSA